LGRPRRWMRQDAAESLTMDDLIQHAHYWLYERHILIPAERTLRDLARSIWSAVERDLLALIEASVPETQLARADALLSTRHESSGMTVLEWLKTPPARHSPSTITETLAKVRFLKDLGAHAWALDVVPIEKQRAYAQRVQARRPVKIRELNASPRTIGLVFFGSFEIQMGYAVCGLIEVKSSLPAIKNSTVRIVSKFV
ncbi:MAG TPA: hypothetical protein VMT20_04175, partial [Terriglobia bacterium]|nr:hypothetical protein [Terriglobia bacterium]